MSAHPLDTDLVAFFEDDDDLALSSVKRERIQDHLDHCEVCRRKMVRLHAGDV